MREIEEAPAVRLLLVDDHEIVRAGLRLLIESCPDFRVVGEAGNCVETLALAKRHEPEVIILDLDLGSENGLDILPRLKESATRSRVIVLTGIRDFQAHENAVAAGALGVVLKDRAADVLIEAIKRVFSGEAWLDPRLTAAVMRRMTNRNSLKADPEMAKIASLTSREREVIAQVTKGLKNKQVADQLFISEATVRHHLTSIFAKLELSDRLELMVYAYKHGLVKPAE